MDYDPMVKEHLDAIKPKYHSLIRDTIEEQLSFEPETETKNRKPLQRPTKFGNCASGQAIASASTIE